MLVSLIDDLLDVTKLEAQRLKLEEGPFELSSVIIDVERLFAARALEKGLALEVTIAPGQGTHFHGDGLRLFSVFEQGDASTTRRFGGTGLGLAPMGGRLHPINLRVATSLVRKAGYEAGFETTVRIRALPLPFGGVPIIALTASTSDEDMVACRRSGMNEVLAKPVSLETLQRVLQPCASAAWTGSDEAASGRLRDDDEALHALADPPWRD